MFLKPIKMLSMIGCGVCFLGMIFTLACFGIFAGSELVSDALDQDGYSYGPGFGSSVTCFVFLLISLVPVTMEMMDTTEINASRTRTPIS